MNALAVSLRSRWFRLPTGILIVLLQRSPAPLLRVLAHLEGLLVNQTPVLLRSGIAAAAMGAYNSLAGATVFNATPATPASGAANSTFTVTGTVGTALSVSFSLSGAPGNPKSWKSSTPLPPGLSVTGGNPLNVTAPYKMLIEGTPTTAGTTSVTVTAYEKTGTTGKSVSVTVTFNITGGSINTAPSFTTQPSGLTVTAGGSATFTVAADGSPPPTYQWQKGGVDISGATNATLSLSNVQSGDAGNYTVIATNSAGSVTSSTATLTVQAASTAPSISSQPANQSVTAGNSASFSVTATGNPAPTYQWQKGGVNISGATSSSLALSNVQSGDAGNYAVVVTNSAGSVTSASASLTVQAAPPTNTAPTISSQPANQSVTAGNSASFSVTATGNPAPTYQWQKGGVNISGATSASLSLSNVQSGDAGNYAVVVTNSAGSVTSASASLTVQAAPPTNTAPTISSQPANQSVTAGNSASFSVTATGNPAPTYQWQKGGVNISGATSASLSLSNVQSGDAGNYAVVVTNSAGSVTSASASLTVQAAPPTNTAPTISSHPVTQSVTAGASVTFSVTATGTPAPTYQWRQGGVNIPGATSATLSLGNVQSGDAGNYTVVVTNSAGSATSAIATLTVQAASSTNAFFSHPTGIVLVGSDSLYLTDSATNTVKKVTTSGEVTLLAGASGSVGTLDSSGAFALFNQPGGLAATGAGVLFVSDSANATIRRISTAGDVTTFAGSATERGNHDGTGTQATFSNPLGLALDSSGNLYVADATNHTIRKITSSGTVSTLAGSSGQAGTSNGTGSAARFNQPAGLAVDASGNVYVADRTNHAIRRITPAGVVTTLAGVPGISGSDNGTGSSALFNLPGGLALDSAGNLYVADTGNCTIRKITPAGAVSTLAGLPTVGGDQDGTGFNAQFNQPGALIADSAGNLYVADTGNAAIRKVTPAGVVTTLTLKQGTTTPSSPTGGTTTPNTSNQNSNDDDDDDKDQSDKKSSDGSGGGGAPSDLFLVGLGTVSVLRWMQRRAQRRTRAGQAITTSQER